MRRQSAHTRATPKPNSSSTSRRASGTAAIGAPAGRRGRGPRREHVPPRAVDDGAGTSPPGRRVSVRPADVAAEVVDKIARGDVYIRPITFPEGLTIREMAELYESQGLRRGGDFVDAARTPRWSRTSIPPRRISRAICSRTPTRCRAARRPRSWCARMVAAFQAGATPELATRRARGLTRAPARDAGVDRREGDGASRTSGRSSPPCTQPAAHRDAAAVRPDRHLRAERAGRYNGNLRATTCSSTRPTTPIATPACRRARSPRPAARRSKRPPHRPPCRYLYFVSRNDGSHAFAATLEEHNRNVQEYQVQYFRDRRLQRH